MATINTGNPADDVVQNLVQVLTLQKVTWKIHEIVDGPPLTVIALPFISVEFAELSFQMKGPDRARAQVDVDVRYWFAEWVEKLNWQEARQQGWNIALWLQQHRTLGTSGPGGEYSLDLNVLSLDSFVRPVVENLPFFAGVRVRVRAWRDNISVVDAGP